MKSIKQLVLIVCLSLGIMYVGTTATEAGFDVFATNEPTNIKISAIVDKYLAVYKSQDGNVSVETNSNSNYLANLNVCVIYY